MADKSIFKLTLQTTFASNDRLVVGNYANSDAEAITGQTLVNLLATALDGHGGIQSIEKTSSSGTDPVVDTYTITMADTTTTTFTVTNGLKGDTGLQTFIYFRWAHVQPSSWSDTTSQPDEWMGVYAGTATTPPTTVSAYTWVKVRGDTGETGEAASISSQSVTYMESTSGTIVPSGSWSENVPSVTPGNFLWTRTQLTFNDDSTVTIYSVSRYGIDGTGAVSSVNGQSPDGNGNVALTASDVPTSDNLSIQAHITAAEDDIDDLQSDMTTAQDDITALDDSLNAIPASRIKGKQIAIYGDSWAADYHGSLGADYISSYTGVTVHVNPDPGGTMQRISETKMDGFVADIYIVSAGLNDVGSGTSLNNYLYAAKSIINAFKALNSDAEIYFITPPMMRTTTVHNYSYPLEAYRIALWRMAAIYGFNVINSLKWTDVSLESDNTHPILADAEKIGKHIVDALITFGDEETHVNDYSTMNNLFGGQSTGRLVCDSGNFYLNIKAYQFAPDQSGGHEKSFTLPTGLSVDFGAFVVSCMSGGIYPVYFFHNYQNQKIIAYRRSTEPTGDFYIGGAYFPIPIVPLVYENQSA